MVYYDRGIFYKPGSSYTNGTPETKGSALYRYNKYFYNMLTTMINDAKKEGYTVKMSVTESGAWRPYEKQQYFWNCYLSSTNSLPLDDCEFYIKDNILYAFKKLNVCMDFYYDTNSGFNLFNFKIKGK